MRPWKLAAALLFSVACTVGPADDECGGRIDWPSGTFTSTGELTSGTPATDVGKAPKTLVLDIAGGRATITYVKNGAKVVETYRVTKP